MQKVLRKLAGKEELREAFPLLDEGCRAVEEHIYGELFPPEIYRMALAGECAVFSVAGGQGICVCTLEQGSLYVNVLYLKVGAERGLMRRVGLELEEVAQKVGALEVRFKTQRPAGMKRVLGELGYQPRCMEFALRVPPIEENE